MLFVYAFGPIAPEVADVHGAGPLPPEGERIAVRERAFSAIPGDDFPLVAATASTRAGLISTEQYLWGLRRILDGITARGTLPGSPDTGEGADLLAGRAS